MNLVLTPKEKCREHFSERLKQFSDPAEAEELMASALALSKQVVYKLELSWGGPGDGFKIFVNADQSEVEDIVYYFADWFVYEERSLGQEEFDKVYPYIAALILG